MLFSIEYINFDAIFLAANAIHTYIGEIGVPMIWWRNDDSDA
jgi:hypothetical protein